jgi:Domain of unknown function (DUF4279)
MSGAREYARSVSLIITGRSLDPASVTRALGLKPTQSWRVGELKRAGNLQFKTRYEEGGWKCFLTGHAKRAGLDVQLKKWASILRPNARSLRRLRSQGNYCRLVWFAATDATVSLVISSELQSDLARLGLDWEISIFSNVSKHAGELPLTLRSPSIFCSCSSCRRLRGCKFNSPRASGASSRVLKVGRARGHMLRHSCTVTSTAVSTPRNVTICGPWVRHALRNSLKRDSAS